MVRLQWAFPPGGARGHCIQSTAYLQHLRHEICTLHTVLRKSRKHHLWSLRHRYECIEIGTFDLLYSISHMCTIISHMYVGVKLVNYPHLYYFSHFTHFTLYLIKCEKYQILFNFVLFSKFPIRIMETSILFPRRLEKHKFLLRSIEGVAFLTTDIGNYPCVTGASTADHYSTTCLQYSVVKIFKNLYKLVVRRLQVH